jgi:signal transduction histidine kinase
MWVTRSGRAAFAWGRAQPVGRRDVALAVAIAVLVFVPGINEQGTLLGWEIDDQLRPVDLWAVLLALGQCLPLAVRHRAPALCLFLVSAAFFVYQCLGYRATIASIGLYLALYTVGMFQVRHRGATAGAGIAGYVALSVCMEVVGAPAEPIEYAQYVVVPAGCWVLGTWGRIRVLQQEQLQLLHLESVMQSERERIARELHDVVTHHVTTMVVQADATPYLLDGERESVEASLSAISGTGRRALADLRELLGLLRPAHDDRPAPRLPTVGTLRELVEQTRTVGQPVELIEDYSSHVFDDATQLAAYRVVQEALTNALKHAPGRRTVVHVHDEGSGQVVVEITTDGQGAGLDPARGPGTVPSGRGLDGLRQRVAMVGGNLVTRYGADGSFVVRATLPTTERAA